MSQAPNNREFTRVPSGVNITLHAKHVTIQSLAARNISMNGIWVQTKKHLALGTDCELDIHLADGEIEIRAQGRVVRTEPEGMAIQFTRIVGLDSFEHLQNLVRYNATDPAMVESELRDHFGIHRKPMPEA